MRYVAADISRAMLERTMAVATRRQVAAQVEPVLADVGALPFADAEFDLVVSFTGLHCFPDPHLAVREMGRVLHPGGVLTGSALLNDTGVRYLPMRQIGRFAGLLGPAATSTRGRALADRGRVRRHLDHALRGHRVLPGGEGMRLVVAMSVLVVTDLVGGLIAVAAGVNTWAEAWGSDALLPRRSR